MLSVLRYVPRTDDGLADAPPDAAYVIASLEQAGRTLLALPHRGYSTRLRTGGLDHVREVIEAYGWTDEQARPATPSGLAIDRMDRALAWIPLIPQPRFVLRRIVGARCLVNPVTDKHLFSWYRIGKTLGMDPRAAQGWHAEGIDLIVAAMDRQK